MQQDFVRFDPGKAIKSVTHQWYKVVQRLGVGGNAVTFLVLGTSGRHQGVFFALKVFQKLSEPARRKSFLSEVEFLQGCDHPSIMRIFDRGTFVIPSEDTDREHPFVVAEYLPQTLSHVIRAGTAPMPLKLAFLLQLLSGLKFLSALDPSIIHRDIKPENIFVKGNSCVLGDFGLMKVANQEDGEDREIFKESIGPGMPFFYRTPDLIRYARNEAELTTKSDVFQLGLVAATLFTGRNPAIAPKDILDDFQREALWHVPGGLGKRISGCIEKMLVIEPRDRTDANTMLRSWQLVFDAAVEKAHRLEGRAI